MPRGKVWEGAAGEASAEGGLGEESWEVDGKHVCRAEGQGVGRVSTRYSHLTVPTTELEIRKFSVDKP